MKSFLDLAWPTLHRKINCAMLTWLTDNCYEENNVYNVGLTRLGQPQVTKMKLKGKYQASKKLAFEK